MNQLQSPQATTPTAMNPMISMQPQSSQIMNTQQVMNPMNQQQSMMMMQQQQQQQQTNVVQQMHMQPIMQRQNSLPAGIGGGMTPQRGYNFNDFGFR